jgi:hypothetical protein
VEGDGKWMIMFVIVIGDNGEKWWMVVDNDDHDISVCWLVDLQLKNL